MNAYYFIPAIIFLGIATSYEDLKFGKIRNKWILFSVAFSFAMYLALFLGNQVNLDGVFSFLFNFAIAVVFSFALWGFKFWSAGDGKLFIAYSALIPLGIYSLPLASFFPSFNLFLNTIVPFFAYLVIKGLLRSPSAHIKKSVFNGIKSFPSILVAIFSISWVIRAIGGNFLNFDNRLFTFAIYAFSYFIINLAINFALKKLKTRAIKDIHFYLALIVLRFVIEPKGILNLDLIYPAILSAVLYALLLRTSYNIVYEKSYKNTAVSKIKKGDIIIKIKNDSRKNSILDFIKRIGVKKDSGKKSVLDFIKIEPEGVTEEDIKKIIRLRKSGKIKATVPVAETVSFAPAMFIGAILTLLFGNIVNIIYWLYYMF